MSYNKYLKLMKKIALSIILTLSISAFSFGQIISDSLAQKELNRNGLISKMRNTNYICPSSPVQNACNYIRNNKFEPTAGYNPNANDPNNSSYWQPFSLNLIDGWFAPSSTPQINNFWGVPSPPMPAIGYSHFDNENDGIFPNIAESVAQRIPDIAPGENFILSFFKIYPGSYTATGVTFKIILANCEDLVNFSNLTPITIPANTQTIYCEINPNNNNWQQNAVKFTSNGNYNTIWILPELATGRSILNLAYPELIKINNFSAGIVSSPDANCMVTVGPSTPNCTVANAVYTWTHGSTSIIATYPSQQIQVDASNPVNVGTWTLTMTVPNAIASNTCVLNPNTVAVAFASVNVTAACGNWPKAYIGKTMGLITKLDNHNIIAFYASNEQFNNGGSMIPNLNHIGVLPIAPVITEACQYSIQYTSLGSTNWTKSNLFPIIRLNNGTLQMGKFNTSQIGYYIIDIGYYDMTTGAATNGPSIVPIGNRIVAETNTGSYISTDASDNLYLNTPLGNSSVIQLGGKTGFKFNKVSNKLFCTIRTNNESILKIYDVANNNFSLIIEKQLILDNNLEGVINVNNNDEVFIQYNRQLFKIDYNGTSLNAVYNLVTIPSVVNNNIYLISSNNPYTDDRFMFAKYGSPFGFGFGFNKIYLLNLLDFTSKQIDAINCVASSYLIDGNDIYLGVNTHSIISNLSIGAVQINQLATYKLQMNLFKFSLNTDFSRNVFSRSYIVDTISKQKNSQPFEISISPNPSNIFIRIAIKSRGFKNNRYKITFKDKFSNTQYQKRDYINEDLINVESFPKGLYFIEIEDAAGHFANTKFIKL